MRAWMAPMMVCSFVEEEEDGEVWGDGGCCCQRARRAMQRDGQLRGSEKKDFW